MKKKILNLLKLIILFIATISAACPSQAGCYQPKVPNQLIKKNKT